jgi:metal-responsive CopG/Arc/MetJ family transcriptional regulator
MICHTTETIVPKSKVAVTLEAELLHQLDRLVRNGHFSNRSQAIESAVQEKLERLKRRRLIEECAKLDPIEEARDAEEGFRQDGVEWPAY